MPLATVSGPFDYLVSQIERDLARGVELCGEVRRNRHVGSQHTQLDALEDALRDGPRFVAREYRGVTDVEGVDLGGADAIAKSDLTCYVRSVEEINERLVSLAHPPTHHPDAHHYNDHGRCHCHSRSHSRSLLFPSWDPPHHKEREDPHFNDLRLKWENAKDGISHTFSQMRYRLEKEAEAEKKKKREDEKKKDDDDKANEEREAEEKKCRTAKKALQDKLDAKEEEEMNRLRLKDKRDINKLDHVEDIAQQRDQEVERLVKTRLEENPIDEIDRLAGVMGHIQRIISPHNSYGHIHQPPINLHVSSSAAGAGSGTGHGGGGGGAHQNQYQQQQQPQPVFVSPTVQQPVILPAQATQPIYIYDRPHHYNGEPSVHWDWDGPGHWHTSPRSSWASHRSHRSGSSYYESPHHSPHHSPRHSPRQTVINNVVEAGHGDVDDETIWLDDDHVAIHEGRRNGHTNHNGPRVIVHNEHDDRHHERSRSGPRLIEEIRTDHGGGIFIREADVRHAHHGHDDDDRDWTRVWRH